jgi:endonuclease YncB( thermonuclease family)
MFGCYAKNDVRIETKLDGKVIKIIDGDTYDILLVKNKILRIRMEGIDAPERGMPFYRVSKDYLGKLCFGKKVRLKITGKDRHGRTIAFTYLDDGTELSHEMIKAGLAWHFKKYSSDSVLSNLEMKARYNRLAIWSDSLPTAPWDSRKIHRKVYKKEKGDFKLNELTFNLDLLIIQNIQGRKLSLT